MATVSATFTAVGVSATLRVDQPGETLTITQSGTYAANTQVERAITRDETAWEVIAGPFTTDDATVSVDYVTTRRKESFRFRCTAFTSGTVTYSVGDGDFEIGKHVDDFGNAIWTATQAGITFPGTMTVDGAATLTGAVTLTGAQTFTGATTMASDAVIRGDIFRSQGTPPALTGAAITPTAAQMLSGIITVDSEAAGAVTLTLPTGTVMDTGDGSLLADGDSFDLAIINIGNADNEDITVTAASGFTIVGSPIIVADFAALEIGAQGMFRCVKGVANTYVAYRIA